MKLLHTADWHLGIRLHEKDRLPEQQAFLEWLLGQIAALQVDVLLVSGDVFDTALPSHEATRLLYEFLAQVAGLKHCTVILTAGNHDSPAQLTEARELLAQHAIHVVGLLPEDRKELLFEFPECVVAAIPFLRDRDLRQHRPGETAQEVQDQLREGIRQVYLQALEQAKPLGKPIVAMGHLTAQGASRCPDSERDIHVGNLASVGPEMFQGYAYVALGHLHGCQSVAGVETIRYSGSPIPLSFAEADYQHHVVLVEVQQGKISYQKCPVPQTRKLLRLHGTKAEVIAALKALPECPEATRPLVDIKISETSDLITEMHLREGSQERAELLRIRSGPAVALAEAQPIDLSEWHPNDLFKTVLQQRNIALDTEAAQELLLLFQQLQELPEE